MEFANIGALTFADSAATSFVQIADLVSYNTFRQFRDHGATYDDPEAKKLPIYEHFGNIVHLFETGPTGVFSGFGIAKWPVKAKKHWLLPKKGA